MVTIYSHFEDAQGEPIYSVTDQFSTLEKAQTYFDSVVRYASTFEVLEHTDTKIRYTKRGRGETSVQIGR